MSWCVSVIPALEKLRQEDQEFKGSPKTLSQKIKSAWILDLYDINRLLNILIFRNRGKEQTPPYPLR